MDINRNNYEGFLLQYVDGELDLAGKNAVEAFVRLNPDLQAELSMLQQTLLQPEPCIFDNKALLYKTSEATQAQLLQYLDKELAPAEAKLLEQQLAADKALQQEWHILQQTQLDAEETILFADKASLYRQEPARLIGIKWWRIAAAALLLGFGVWGGVALMNGHNGGKVVDNGLATAPAATGTQTGIDTKTNTLAVDSNKPTADNKATVAVVNDNNTIAQPVMKTSVANPVAVKDDSTSLAQQSARTARWSTNPNAITGQNDLDRVQKTPKKIISQNFNNASSNETANNNVTLTNKQLEPAVATPIEKTKTEKLGNTDIALNGNAARLAVNETNDVGATNDYLAISSKKTRRSGLLRKVTRFFKRSVNNRGEGDGLKIAGFEFAVR